MLSSKILFMRINLCFNFSKRFNIIINNVDQLTFYIADHGDRMGLQKTRNKGKL